MTFVKIQIIDIIKRYLEINIEYELKECIIDYLRHK